MKLYRRFVLVGIRIYYVLRINPLQKYFLKLTNVLKDVFWFIMHYGKTKQRSSSMSIQAGLKYSNSSPFLTDICT
jgi:hypothetical protein